MCSKEKIMKSVISLLFIIIVMIGCSDKGGVTPKDVDKDVIILDKNYILFAKDGMGKKYKIEVSKGSHIDLEEGTHRYKHPKLGTLIVIKMVEKSKQPIGGGWDFFDDD